MNGTTQAAESASPSAWPKLLGSNNLEGLLDPLDLSLRKLILRCGDLCQATYDAFNNDQNSKYCGSSRYGKASFFDKVMLDAAADYKVVAFLYATAKVSQPETRSHTSHGTASPTGLAISPSPLTTSAEPSADVKYMSHGAGRQGTTTGLMF